MADATATPKETDAQERWRWKVESAATTLQEAVEIRDNPKLHNAALKELAKRAKAAKRAIKGSPGAAVR